MDIQMKVEPRTSLKRPLSFSDDSVEWDSIRDEIPADVGWNSMKLKDGNDEGAEVNANGLPVDWIPFGYVRGRKGKKQRLELGAFDKVKKERIATIDKLENEGEREVANQILQSIPKYCGSFVFESSDNKAFSQLVPFPSSFANTKMGPKEDWQFEKSDCKLETLLAKSPSKKFRNVAIPPWKGAKRRERKHEAKNIKREVKLEDLTIEDGVFSWATFANLVKPQFAAMEPQARCEAAKKFSAILQGDLSSTS